MLRITLGGSSLKNKVLYKKLKKSKKNANTPVEFLIIKKIGGNLNAKKRLTIYVRSILIWIFKLSCKMHYILAFLSKADPTSGYRFYKRKEQKIIILLIIAIRNYCILPFVPRMAM
ncbi:hypothetical protein HMPREF0454_03833 [Hafnia alvei ATCC 51873]|uniref:Uncharacterized protein n=1 Tax=Hafnia alvei ATCC 51873 TaxID=1002364 RepID=G9YB54_HAFAL|nr:hypothetical protein HMPREF0454_03833 [Hafnia alvei ATCC 51873]